MTTRAKEVVTGEYNLAKDACFVRVKRVTRSRVQKIPLPCIGN